MQKLCEFQLPRGRKTVFRLVQQVERVLADALTEHRQRTFAVGAGAHIGGQRAAGHLGLAVPPRCADLLEPVVVLHTVHLELFAPQRIIICKHLFAAHIHAVIQRPQVQHIVKHIITRQDQAACRHRAHCARLTQAHVIVKERRAVVLGPAMQPQCVGHHI